MQWKDVGEWLKGNAGTGAALVGSLLTGNVPGAVAAGVALVSGATGHADPAQALQAFQNEPATVIKLKELANADAANIREHIRAMTELEFKDAQAEQSETQQTIRAGDNSQDPFVRRTRPAQSWVSLVAAIVYVFWQTSPSEMVLGALMALPLAYAGLRQLGKWTDARAAVEAVKAQAVK